MIVALILELLDLEKPNERAILQGNPDDKRKEGEGIFWISVMP